MNLGFKQRCAAGLWGGLLGLGWSAGAILLGTGFANALDPNSRLLLTEPLTPAEVNFLEAGTPPADPAWVTANTISQTSLTTPSLWWAKQQFGGKLLSNWLAKPSTGEMPSRVDLLVNQQVWNSYNYLDRYAFLNQVGTSAEDFGYSTRVFNDQGELLGAYICEFREGGAESSAEVAAEVAVEGAAGGVAEGACTIFLDPSGAGAVRGTGATGALRSIGGSIGR
jgi:hypothetical protein